MFIFPLGLGHRPIIIPFMTILLVVANISLYFVFKPKKDIDGVLDKTFTESGLKREELTAFLNFCIEKYPKNKICKDKSEAEEILDNKKSKSKKTEKNNFTEYAQFAKAFIEFKELSQNIENLKHLQNYNKYVTAKSNYMEKLIQIYEENNFLSRYTLNLFSLFKAQFSHADILHLLSNMIFLIIFGIYVDHRVGFASYFIFYLVGGTIGMLTQLYLTSESHYYVGASANLYTIIGMFYALFYGKKMKFYLWYFSGRTITVSVRIWLPLVVFANEIIATLMFNNVFSDGVAHIAHLGGLAFGIFAGFFMREMSPLHKHFLYAFENQDWHKAKKSANAKSITETAMQILEFNPFNDTVLDDFMGTLVEDFQKSGGADLQIRIQRFFPIFFKYCINTNNQKLLIHSLEAIQNKLSPEILLRNRPTKDLIGFGDYCVKEQHYMLAIYCYVAFIHSISDAKSPIEILQSISNIIDHMDYKHEVQAALQDIAERSHNVFLKKKLFEKIQIYQQKKTNPGSVVGA